MNCTRSPRGAAVRQPAAANVPPAIHLSSRLHAANSLRRAALCRPSAAKQQRSRAVQVEARAGRGSYYSSQPDIIERVIAAVPYIIPFLDSLTYGIYLFRMFPIILKTLKPILPLHALYTGNSLVHFAAFFGLYLVLVSDTFKLGLSRFVRFNAAQALLLNVLLMLPRLFEMVLSPPTAGPMLKAYVMAQNAIWITVAVAVGASVLGCFVGTSIRLPYIASAADQQASG